MWMWMFYTEKLEKTVKFLSFYGLISSFFLLLGSLGMFAVPNLLRWNTKDFVTKLIFGFPGMGIFVSALLFTFSFLLMKKNNEDNFGDVKKIIRMFSLYSIFNCFCCGDIIFLVVAKSWFSHIFSLFSHYGYNWITNDWQWGN